jgi:hypothetical protein
VVIVYARIKNFMQSPVLTKFGRLIGLAALLGGLSACGGSSSNSDFSYAYLHFYNGSPNGATVYVLDVDEDDDLGSASFGDASSLISTDDTGSLDLEFYRVDSDDQEITVDEMTVTMKTGYKTLVVLQGDFDDPEFIEYRYKRKSLDDHFRLMATSVTLDEQSYDIYMSDSGDPFESANYLGTIVNGELTEYDYWDPDDDSDYFDEDEYTIYLTLPGEDDVVFETTTIDFDYSTEYVLILRDMSGAIQTGMSMDIVLNSTSVTNLTDVDATSQYRIYNSVDSDSSVTVTFSGDDDDEAVETELEPGDITDFTEIEYGDYRITAVINDGSLTTSSNKLVTLNQDESKAIIIYANEGNLNSLSFEESDTSQAYDKTVNFTNLVDEYSDVDFYLVRSDETIDTAEYSVQSVEYEETETDTIPEDYYEIIAVYEDDNDEQYLLYRLPSYAFEDDTNYFVTLEPSSTSSTGYEIVVNN